MLLVSLFCRLGLRETCRKVAMVASVRRLVLSFVDKLTPCTFSYYIKDIINRGLFVHVHGWNSILCFCVMGNIVKATDLVFSRRC